MKNFSAFAVKYIPPSASKSSRVKITSLHTGKAKFVPFNHEYRSIEEQAAEYLRDLGGVIVGRSTVNDTSHVELYSILNLEWHFDQGIPLSETFR